MNKNEQKTEVVTEVVNAKVTKVLFFGFMVRESPLNRKKFVLGKGESVSGDELSAEGFSVGKKDKLNITNNKDYARIEDLTELHENYLFLINRREQINWPTKIDRQGTGRNFDGGWRGVIVRQDLFDRFESFGFEIPALLVTRVREIRK